ncbi:hypothetical protein DFQ28_011074 [Apophysomyces sp. BC1034]|nr:hypothetical protein DFQ29_002995 [Apophysomyces sp. BC1021]KAG0184477.1 hypothetical protein DFQ28_011074 [Apophysomyces sp. BC1034]
MAFDATIYQNAAEVITLAVLNILCTILAALQAANGQKYNLNLSLSPIKTAISLEIAASALLGVSAIVFAYLSYVVVREFGWVIYKKIGADVAIQRMYRTFQFFVLALKIDTFLEFLVSGFYVLQVLLDSFDSLTWVTEWDTWIELIVTIMVLPMLYFGRMAVSAESKKRMVIFILFQVLVIFQFLLVLLQTVDPDDFWYTWMCFVLVGMVFSVATAVLALLCMRNFNKGLAPHVQRGSKKKQQTDHLELSKHVSNSSWKIDDDDDD